MSFHDDESYEESEEHFYNLLRYDKKILQYLNTHYNADNTDHFLKGYASRKETFMREGEALAQRALERDEEIIQLAQKCLLQVQQKKLFDIILQWNANQFKHESIQCSRDFEQWEFDLTQCPFLSPISKEEFNLYLQYAQSSEFDYEDRSEFVFMSNYFDKENHEKITDFNEDDMLTEEDKKRFAESDAERKEWSKEEEWEDNSEIDKEIKWGHFHNQPDFPVWFAFNNAHTDNGRFLKLPQLRVPKEQFYLELGEKAFNEELEEEFDDDYDDEDTDDDGGEPAKPIALPSDYYTLKKFIMACEDKDVLDKFTKYYDAYPQEIWQYSQERNRHAWLEHNAQIAFENMKGITKLIPVEANKDWRKAISDAYHNFRRQQVAFALPYVYSDYCTRIKNNLGFNWQKPLDEGRKAIGDIMKNRILQGRKLNGEPEDFDF